MENQELKEKTILIVDTGPLKKKFIFQKLKKLGLKIIVMNKEKNWAESYVDKWILTDNYNHTQALSSLQAFIKNNPRIKIDGVLTFWEDHVLLTSKIVDKFNFIGIPFDIAKKVRNKFKFREFCEEYGIKTPKHKLLSSNEDVRFISKNFSFPLVVKPAFGSDSVYVVKVKNEEELKQTLLYIKQNIAVATEETSSLADGFDILVEEYIDGDEVDIDIILQNGKIKFYSIADNYNKNHAQFFLDSGQAIPSSLPPHEQNSLITMAEEALEKLGIQNGCIHFEAKATKNGPVPIEINLRMGGDYVYSYIKGTWGVDLIEQSVKVAIGQYTKIEKPTHPYKYIVGWDLHPASSGILVERDIKEELKEKKYLEEVHFYKEIGDPILLPPDGYELLGWITVSGDNQLDAQDNLKEALELISYKVVEFNEESSVGKTSRENRFSMAVLNQNLLLQAAKRVKVKRATLENQRNLHIGIATNIYGNESRYEELESALYIEKELRKKGYHTTLLDFNNFPLIFNEVRRNNVDLVFNVSAGVNNVYYSNAQASAFLEGLQIPFTGSSSVNNALNLDRIRTKKLLAFHHIPTPRWDYIFTLQDKIKDDLPYPLILKPAYKTNIYQSFPYPRVVHKKNLTATLEKFSKKYTGPLLLEECIEGAEYIVPILGTEKTDIKILPLVKVLQTKKHTESFQCPPKGISEKLEALISEIALDAYRILHIRDYGSVRIRVDGEDNPYVISIESRPLLSPKSYFCKAAERMKLSFSDILEEIINLSITRYKNQKDVIDYL